MKYLFVLLMACGSSNKLPMTAADAAALNVQAQHSHMVKHNMVLFGDTEIFASHIVYKEPHNYQVILKLSFEPEVVAAYNAAKAEKPDVTLIYFLDHMHIADIASLESITGTILFRDEDNVSHPIRSDVTLTKSQFSIVFFNEVPLSLAGD